MSKRILMVAPQPFFSARGTPFSVLHRIRALIDSGYSVDLATYGYGEDIEMDGLRIFRCAKLPIVDAVKIGPSIPKLLLDILLYRTTVKLLKENSYEVFHSHEEAAFYWLRLSKYYKMPHVYDMHSSLPQQLSNFKSYNFSFLKRIFEKLEHKVLDSCDAVITICDDLAKIVEAGYAHKPHKMIENIGEDRKIFQPNERHWKKELSIDSSEVLLYTGTFEAYQGIDLFLQSLKTVLAQQPDCIALLVGGTAKQIEHYKEMGQELGISGSLRFTGTVHPSNIPNLIDMSTLIVSPRSRGTNTPLKIYNYMRTGKPLVATDRLTHTQILSSDVACLVDATPEGFAKGILQVLQNTDYARQISEAAAAFAKEHFSDEHYIDMVNGLYEAMWESIA